MKRFKLLLYISIIYTTIAYGQDINDVESNRPHYPEYKTYNRDLKTYWMKEPAFCEAAEQIEALTLRCDTVTDGNKYLFFDDKNRLRKFWTYYSFNDGSHEYLELRAYYDNIGKLVYLDYSSGSNCEDASGHFIVRNGKIIDGEMNDDCGCCGDDPIPSPQSFVIGEALPRRISWWDSSALLEAATLLKILSIYKYEYTPNLELTGKEEAFAEILDNNIIQELQEKTIMLDEKGRSTITTLYDKTENIRKCDINKSSEKDGEFIKLYYDEKGDLYLIRYDNVERISDREKNRESFTFYIESGVISGGGYYRNFGFDKTIEDADFYCDNILQELIGSRLSEAPHSKKDLSWMINTKELRKALSNLKAYDESRIK